MMWLMADGGSAAEGAPVAAGASAVLAGDVTARRFAAQLLSGPPAASPAEVVARLLAVQGQDRRGARLAVRARTTGLTAADVDRAFTVDRSLLITWLNRGTLHLVCQEDYWWLHHLTTRPQFEVGARRILARAGGVALHVLMLASLQGKVVRGPMAGGQHAYVHVRDWLGTPPSAPDPDHALAELARRYLAGHGPATERDLAKWAGLPVSWVRRGLTAIAARLRDRSDGLAELTAAPEPESPPPRLLGAYDPVLLGWLSREPVLAGHAEIVTVNGLFRPFALVAGRAAGIWSYQGGQVQLDRFGPLSRDAEAALAAEVRDVCRYLAAEPAGPASTASTAR